MSTHEPTLPKSIGVHVSRQRFAAGGTPRKVGQHTSPPTSAAGPRQNNRSNALATLFRSQSRSGSPTDPQSQARRGTFELVYRRARAIVRLHRIDSPVLWRSAAHGAVLVLTLGVFLVSRTPLTVTAGGEGSAMLMAEQVEQPFNVAQYLMEAASEATPGSPDGASAHMDAAAGAAQAGFSSPGLIAEADSTLLPFEDVQEYVVASNDNLSTIANRFGISIDTLMYNNKALRDNPHSLQQGQKILVAPVDGIVYTVKAGDTLESLAQKYGAQVGEILKWKPNKLKGDPDLQAGLQLVIPGGSIPLQTNELGGQRAVAQKSTGQKAGQNPLSRLFQPGDAGPVAGTGTFTAGAYGRITTRFSRWHQGADIANRTGTPIYAIDGGRVVDAGWGAAGFGWAGNAVYIDHGNGYRSLYAHMSRVNISAGQVVQRGQIIGAIGCSRGPGGRCTGPHLHLEVYNNGRRVNPCSVGACP